MSGTPSGPLTTEELEGVSGGTGTQSQQTTDPNFNNNLHTVVDTVKHDSYGPGIQPVHGTVQLSGNLHINVPTMPSTDSKVQVMTFSNTQGEFQHVTPTVNGQSQGFYNPDGTATSSNTNYGGVTTINSSRGQAAQDNAAASY